MPKRKAYRLQPIQTFFLRRQKRRKQQIRLRHTPDDIHFENAEPLIEWRFVQNLQSKENSRFRAREVWSLFEVQHNFQSIPDLMAYQTSIDNAFEGAMRPHFQDLDPNDLFGAYIEHSGLKTSIYLRPQPIKDFDKRSFLNRIYAVSQSSRSFFNDGLLKVRVVTYRSLSGRGRGSKAPKTYSEAREGKQSVIRIHNTDNSCGYRAVAIGIKMYEWDVEKDGRQSRWHHLYQRESAQQQILFDFCESFGFDPRKPVDTEVLKQMDHKITDYQIIVIQDCRQVFVGTDRANVIYLLYDGQHYDLIKSMTGYLHRKFYCKYCNVGYQNAIFHRCNGSCFLCRSPFKCPSGVTSQCKDCLVTFRSRECFVNHLKFNVCKDRHYCPNCEIIYTVRTTPHQCFQLHCKVCNQNYVLQPHFCHMSPLDSQAIAEEDKKCKVFVAYDIECMIEGNEIYSHTPVLLVSRTICDKCPECGVCAGEQVLYGTDCIERFVEYLLDLSKEAEKKKLSITAFAHNGSGYDSHWILRELMRRGVQGLEPTLNGTKIMKLDAGNLRFIDTLLLFQRPLADLPKMFGLQSGAKGFFPHFANTRQNQSLVCRLHEISPEFFGRKFMNFKRAADFDNWYEENKDKVYDLKREMIKYCRSDVSILLDALFKFRSLFKDQTKIDPLTRSFTLASIGLEYFRAQHLKENVIGITPIGGYNNYRQQSFAGNAWLDCMEETLGLEIIREYKIGKFYADGCYPHPKTIRGNTYSMIAFEFNGCRFHGHGCSPRNFNKDLLDKLEERRQYFLKHNIYPMFQWECEWNGDEFYEQRFQFHKRMATDKLYCDPRSALHGGRTNNLRFTHKVSDGEELKYLDFTSLYPFVLSRKPYPGSHPKVIRKNFPDISSIFGFISCKVLAPKDLYLPVLPYTSNGKLLFSLCRTCAETQFIGVCEHSQEDRAFIGCFVSVELQEAVRRGYVVLEIYEILHYETVLNDLFRPYVDKWYKMKAEASGYPKNVKTLEEKNRFECEFLLHENIRLDEVKANPGLRSIAKLMLNSFWGKFCQRPDLPVTRIVKDYQEMYEIFASPKYEVLGDVMIEDLMLINYRHKDVRDARVGNTSVAIASFVTAYARLELYREMERIEQSSPGSVLYFDTDSIVFVHKAGHYCPHIGSFLGEMTDEIVEEFGVDAKMEEFHTLGPKTYAYKVQTPNGPIFKMKAKGISQNLASEETCNFERLREMAENTVNSIPNPDTYVTQQQFRTSAQHEVSTLELTKKFTVTSDKRMVFGNTTLPYGFVNDELIHYYDSNTFAELMIN